VRARETADRIAEALVPGSDRRAARARATTEDLRAAVAGRGETVVVVGHQPDCGKIAATLTGGPEPRYPTAGVRELDV
jgi:phosphohistidine phosphatase SixA